MLLRFKHKNTIAIFITNMHKYSVTMTERMTRDFKNITKKQTQN